MSKHEQKWPRCPECGGQVTMRGGRGRTREYRRGVHLAIPDDFKLPTCARCAEVLMAPEITATLDELLGARYREQSKRELEVCVEVLKARHEVTQQEIEDACGVTRSYLSHLLSGRKEPSLMFMKLMRSFVLAPDAFEHARTNQPLSDYLSGFFAVAAACTAGTVGAGSFGQQKTYRAAARWERRSGDTRLCA